MADIKELTQQNATVSHENRIYIKKEKDDEYKLIKGLESNDEQVSNTIEKVYTFDNEGFVSAYKTGIDVSFGFDVVYDDEDEVHRDLISTYTATGNEANRFIKIEGPDVVTEFLAVVDLSASARSGATTSLLKLSGTFQMTGKPIISNTGYARSIRAATTDKK